MIAGGYLYGFKTAVLITAVTTIAGSQLAYLLSRRAGRPFVDRFVPDHLIEKWDRAAEKQGAFFFLMTFWVPIFPSDLMCFIAGLGKVRPWPFFAANFLGRLPTAIFMVLIGSDGYRMSQPFWIAVGVFLVLLMVAWHFIQRRLFSHNSAGVNELLV